METNLKETKEINDVGVHSDIKWRRHFNLIGWFLMAVGAAIVLVLVFGAGVAVGFKKASFSYRFGENYQQLFGGRRDLLREGNGRGFMNSHGAAGEIISIAGNSIVIKGSDGAEKNILAPDTVAIRANQQDIKFADLKIGESITVIGAPNDQGQIEARLIRIMPPAVPAAH